MSASSDPPTTTQVTLASNGEDKKNEPSAALRQKSLQIFIQAVAEIEKLLASEEAVSVAAISHDTSVVAMHAQARSRASKQKTRHELATILAIDALNNADNAHWDLFEHTTDTNAEQVSHLPRWLFKHPDSTSP